MPEFGGKPPLVSSVGSSGTNGSSFAFVLGLAGRWPIGNMGRAGITGPGVLLKTFDSLPFIPISSAKDGDGWACGKLRPGGARGVEERMGKSREP